MNSYYSILFTLLIATTIPYKGFSQELPRDWSNPVLILGSSFGKVFQGYYKIGDYEKLLQLTSKQTRKQYSDSIIIKYYQQMQFGYRLKLISMKKHEEYFILNYTTNISATESIISMKLIVELDTCRIVLPSKFLQQKYFLLW